MYVALQFEVLRHRGKLAEVQELVAATIEQDPALKVYMAALGLIYCADGQRDKAAELWAKLSRGGALSVLDGAQTVLVTLSIVSELVFALGDAASAAALLPAVRDRSDDFATAPVAIMGSMKTPLAMLCATLGDYDLARPWFDASIVACDGAGLDPEATHVRLHLARYLVEMGRSAEAEPYARRALETAGRLGMDGSARNASDLLSSLR